MHTARIAPIVLAISVLGAGLMSAGVRAGAAQAVQPLEGDVSPVHDPVVIKEKGTYYVFAPADGTARART